MCSGANLIINHPDFFINIALLLIPQAWFLHPLLRIIGLGWNISNEIHLFSMSRSLTFSALGSAVHAFNEGSPLAVLQSVFAALILIPESWFLGPLLGILGFGPLGPVKGNEIHLFIVCHSLTILGLRICCGMGTGGTLGRGC